MKFNLKKYKNFNNLPIISLKKRLPQVGSYKLEYEIENNKIILDSENEWLDFVINLEGDLIIGHGHYKISNKAKQLIFAGKLKIKDGKIININGESGHYIPNYEEIEKVKKFLFNIFNNEVAL